jgi:gliding motility-associated-like protein
MTIYVYPMIHPAITITPSKTQVCRGEEVTFTATANGGASPRLSWQVNGQPTGEVGAALITSTLQDGDSVSCTITIDQDSRCHTSTSAPSNTIKMQVRDYADPTLMIAASPTNVCAGTAITFTATEQNAGDLKQYRWQVNGRNILENSPTYVNSMLANGDKVSCTLTTSIPGCSIMVSVASNLETVTVRHTPLITFSPPEVSVMSGETAQLSATVSGNPASVAWQPAAALVTPRSLTSLTIPLTSDSTFNLTVIDINGCAATKEMIVKVLHSLRMPSAFTPNKDGKNDFFRIPAGSSLSLQEFSIFDRWGKPVFKTSDITEGWSGIRHGTALDTGTYVYVVKGFIQDKEVVVKGTVTLLR